jgi:hypothetical protein
VDRPWTREAKHQAALPTWIVGVLLQDLTAKQRRFDFRHIEIVIEPPRCACSLNS